MTDSVDAATRSRIMSRIRGKNTGPELKLRKALHSTGARYRIHDASLPSRPDISHKGARLAVFVDGCYWHGCPEHFRIPRSNVEFWQRKRAYVDDLRRRKKAELERLGFLVIEIWEHEVRRDAAAAASAIAHTIANRIGHRREQGPATSPAD